MQLTMRVQNSVHKRGENIILSRPSEATTVTRVEDWIGSRQSLIFHEPHSQPIKDMEQLRTMYPNSFDNLAVSREDTRLK